MYVLVVVGTRGVTTTSGRGRFHCPQCGGEQDYRRRRVRRFFTLFWLPVVPLDRLGEYVECAMCAATFETAVLERGPDHPSIRDFEALYKRCVRELMVRMLLADGRVAEPELEMIERLYPKLTGETIDRTQVEREVERVRELPASGDGAPGPPGGDGAGALGSVRASAPFLNDMGKETLLQAAVWIAGADGDLDEAETEFMARLARDLGMSGRRMRSVMGREAGGTEA